MVKKPMICLFAVMLLTMLSCVCCGETIAPKTVNVKLISYDLLNRYEYTYAEYGRSIWLRYKVEYDKDQYSIEDMEILYSGLNEDRIDDISVLSVSDPLVFDYRFGCIWMKDHVNDSYVSDLIRDGHMTARILLRERDSGEELTVECDVDSGNAVVETQTDNNAYEIVVCKYEYEEIDVSNRYPDAKLRMYLDTHPDIKSYRIKLYGRESRKLPYRVIGGVEFYSLSPYLFLERDGGVGGVSTSERLNAYDLMEDETGKEITFEGILLANDTESIRESIQNAEMVVIYSTEYAGTFDTSDAGDRFDGPRLCESIVIDLDKRF